MTPRPNSTTRPAPATAKKSLTPKALAAAPRAVRTPISAPSQSTAPRVKPAPSEATSRVLDLTLPLETSETQTPATPKGKPNARKAQPQVVASQATEPAETVLESGIEADTPTTPSSAEIKSVADPSTVVRPRAIKRRSPADLAGQYTREEKAAKRAPVALPIEAAKTVLRGKAAREAKEQRRQAMAVNDAVLQRLRNTASASSLVITLPDSPDEIPAKKGRGYEVECGKCGTSRKFSTPATLCARCGTILVKA